MITKNNNDGSVRKKTKQNKNDGSSRGQAGDWVICCACAIIPPLKITQLRDNAR